MPLHSNSAPGYDLHVHSRFSCDSSASMETLCRRAIDLGLRQIAFTEHVDYVPADIGYGFFRPAAFLDEIARCRNLFQDRLTILAGVETGEFHRYRAQADALLASYSFDLVIASLHWVSDQLVFDEAYFEKRSMDQAYRDYFDELGRMCQAGGFDVLGHLDIVKRYGFDRYQSYQAGRYEESIRIILGALVEQGIALEVNTSTLRRPVGETSPASPILNWYREMGGERVTIGSDAHQAADLAGGWDTALDALRSAGLSHLTTFSGRQPRTFPWETL